MTKAERMKAFEMRLDGHNWAGIGKALGYEGHSVSADLARCVRTPPRQPNICYPVLREYVVSQFGGSVTAFADHFHVSRGSVYAVLRGDYQPKKDFIDALISATGLPYEELFSLEEH